MIVDVQPPTVLQYSPYFDQPNPWLSCPFRLSLHVVGNPTRLMGLIPRTARRENRCPLTPLAHFYTSDRHENWWVYRFKVAEHDAGDSKSNGSLVLPQFAKYGPIPPKISAITTSKVSTEVNSSVEPRVGLQIHLGITEDQSSGPLVSKIPLFTHPSPIVSKGGVYITTHDVHVHIWCTLHVC